MSADHREAALAIIRDLARQGHAVRYIARALDIAGIPTPSGKPGAPWTLRPSARLGTSLPKRSGSALTRAKNPDPREAAPAVDLDYIGREARSRISFAEKHAEKFLALSKSAGVLLKDAKAQLKHGEWLPWLARHGIAERTARRCMELVGMTEEQATASVEAKRAHDREYQRRRRETGTSRADMPPPAPRPSPSEVTSLPRSRVVSQLTDEQWEDVRGYIKSKFGI